MENYIDKSKFTLYNVSEISETVGDFMPKSSEELLEYWKSIPVSDSVFKADCEGIIYILDNCKITVPEENNFFVCVNADGEQGAIFLKVIAEREKPYFEKAEKIYGAPLKAKAFGGNPDFNHTSPVWEDVFELGIPGLKARIEEYAKKIPPKKEFYECVGAIYDAIIRFMYRAADEAEKIGKTKMAKGIRSLAENKPQNLFEAMQLSFIMYVLTLSIEDSFIRTLGRADKLLFPYIDTVIKEEAKKLFDDYIWEMDGKKYDANVPFAICGTDENGDDTTNEASYMLLDAYKRNDVAYVKLHILCSEKTPDCIIKNAFEGIREGKNSIVFMGDEVIIRSLKKQGASDSDAKNYQVVGCYECGANNEVTCSCNGEFNIPKAVEYTLFGGVDTVTGEQVGLKNSGEFASFDELFAEVQRQLTYIIEQNIALVNFYEANYKHFHASPILSSTYQSCVEAGKEIYTENGARYSNSSLNAMGLATATDSLFAIKKLVYEDKSLTLDELREILKKNWQGSEQLRLMVKNKFPKFGMGDTETTSLAKKIMETVYPAVCGKPNAKGGLYRLGTFSIDWRWEFGKMTAASADGRLMGEPISQNSSASFGCDRNGVTAHLLSVTGAIDSEFTPNGTIVDVDLHESAVKGDTGLNAMLGTLRAYFKQGGFAVHYNVLNTKTLEAARVKPADYPTLQVRVCGWNSKFTELSAQSQDEFIERSKR